MQKPQIPIFMQITDAEWDEMVRLLCLREKKFKKNTIIFHQGDITEEMGIVIKGNVNIENVDISGNVSLLGNAEAGDVFAETYALCGEAMAVDAVATSETVILFLPMKQLMHEKNAGYSWYGKMQANIIRMLSKKNLVLSNRIFCTTPKKIRDRVYTYLSMQRVRSGCPKFKIPFNRQQMADYLNLDRSALSKELGLMQEEGILSFYKNEFELLEAEEYDVKDKDIREPLFDFLEEQYGKVRIIEEKTMGKSRADVVMVLEEELVGIEIKSDADTYARLSRQVKDYDLFFDRNYVVAGSKHAHHVGEHVPEWWGIITVEEVDGVCDFYVLRKAEKNPKQKMLHKIKLLWRPELAHIQEVNHLPAYKQKSKDFVRKKIMEKVPEDLLHKQISDELFERDYTTIQQQIDEFKKR